ncbi:MAG: class I SAM-dependent methyltransferase [Clostridiaceae bacterium]|nr:class I SAM-dependent methyltransferase [Clostridiaceae bacterium]
MGMNEDMADKCKPLNAHLDAETIKKREIELAASLTAESTDLIPFLPYLLQDIYELGSSPTDIEALLRENTDFGPWFRVLDLACGKGAVSIHLASKFGCSVRGVDFLQDFVNDAIRKSTERFLDRLCRFEWQDANVSVECERGYDLVILGAAGNVLGDLDQTLHKLRQTIRRGGYMIIDDAYTTNQERTPHYTWQDWLDAFARNGVKCIAHKTFVGNNLEQVNAKNQQLIIQRAEELKQRHPEFAELFDSYVRAQQEEIDELEGDLMPLTWLLMKE